MAMTVSFGLLLWLSAMRERMKLVDVMKVDDPVDIYHGSRRSTRMRFGHRARMVSRVKVGVQYAARHISKIFTAETNRGIFDGRIELDTHADTFVAGRNCLVLGYTERVCDVMPYSDDYEPKTGIPIVKAATGYTAASGERSILVFNEALWMPEMECSLMNPNQLRHFGVEVQDNPYHPEPMVIRKDGDEEGFVACLKSAGTNIFIDTWTPAQEDLESYQHVELTSSRPWDPHMVQFPGLSEVEMSEIEERNLSLLGTRSGGDSTKIEYDDAYRRPLRIFDIRAFNARIMKSSVVPTRISSGPLSEDEILPPKLFYQHRDIRTPHPKISVRHGTSA